MKNDRHFVRSDFHVLNHEHLRVPLFPCQYGRVGLAVGRKEELSADDVLSLLGDDALTYSEWLGKAEEKLFTSRDTFKRRLRKLKLEGRIRESAAEEGKYVRA